MIELRLDSWDAEHGASQSADPADEPTAEVDLTAETASVPGVTWDAPVAAPPIPHAPERVGVIDGVRRVHARLFAEDHEMSAPALAGSWAVGVLYAGPQPALGQVEVGRELIVGGNLDVPSLEVVIGNAHLCFRPRRIPETDPLATLNELQQTMRRAEAELARRLAASEPEVLLVRDGPLAYVTNEPVLGLVKQTMRQYLPPAERALCLRLATGERSPIFALADTRGERRRRWSWYMRLAERLPVEGAMVGVVRMELSGAASLDDTRALVTRAQAALPRLASDRLRDGRAPQNLYPIGALEEQLHRRLGERDLIHRRLVGRVVELACAAPATITGA